MSKSIVHAGRSFPGFNKPIKSSRPNKRKMILVKDPKTGKPKIVHFGDPKLISQGRPKKGESSKAKNRRKSFKARHAKNIARGPGHPAYYANKYLW